jgi:hypothetical protein
MAEIIPPAVGDGIADGGADVGGAAAAHGPGGAVVGMVGDQGNHAAHARIQERVQDVMKSVSVWGRGRSERHAEQ